MAIVLYSYFRSSAAYRVRIALNLKQVDYQIRPVHLLKEGGEQYSSDYKAINPQARVPTLMIGDRVFTQSLAIIEYLEEVYPEPPLLPAEAGPRAYVRSLAQLISSDIHPLNNLSVLAQLDYLSVSEEQKQDWYCHWIEQGFSAFEILLAKHACNGRYCLGESPTMADCVLIPQVYNALRFHCNLNAYPLINSIYQYCTGLSAFNKAAPKSQPDDES